MVLFVLRVLQSLLKSSMRENSQVNLDHSQDLHQEVVLGWVRRELIPGSISVRSQRLVLRLAVGGSLPGPLLSCPLMSCLITSHAAACQCWQRHLQHTCQTQAAIFASTLFCKPELLSLEDLRTMLLYQGCQDYAPSFPASHSTDLLMPFAVQME